MPPKTKSKYRKTVPKPKPLVRIPSQVFRERKQENLIGPVRLSILEHKEMGFKIILLGDNHTINVKCLSKKSNTITIHQYLQQLFENYQGTEYIDFFLEQDFASESRLPIKELHRQELKDEKVHHSFLLANRIQFDNCFQTVKKQCEFYGKPIRFHYSDVRNGVVHSGTDDKTKETVKKLQDLWITSNQNTPQYKSHHIKFLLELIAKLKEGDIDYFFRLTKIDKQLKHIPHKRLVELLRQYTSREFQHHESYFTEYERILTSFLEQSKRQENALDWMIDGITFGTLVNQILAIDLAALFDVYTLARIFRHSMKQIIIYAGDGHILPMRTLFKLILNFKEPIHRESNSSKSFQCISLKGVPQPWFQ